MNLSGEGRPAASHIHVLNVVIWEETGEKYQKEKNAIYLEMENMNKYFRDTKSFQFPFYSIRDVVCDNVTRKRIKIAKGGFEKINIFR